MSSVEYLRQFVNERLTAAAEEIFGVFQQKISEYEEEIGRQRKLLGVIRRPVVILQRTELPQQNLCEEGEVPDLQLCKQERYSGLNQEDKESTQIKVKQEEPCSIQEGEQLEVKQETHTFMLTSVYEENVHSEVQTVDMNPDEILEESVANTTVWSSVTSDPVSELQPLSNSSQVASITGQKGEKCEESRSIKDAELRQKTCHVNNVCNPNMFITPFNRDTSKKSLTCNVCGKEFKFLSRLQTHLRVHTGERPYVCKTCGKEFRRKFGLKCHMGIHTGERPYVCTLCGKDFTQKIDLTCHMRIHTGERPYVCTICGKDFKKSGELSAHIKIHTGVKPHVCQTCGKDFIRRYDLACHMRIHTGEKPYACTLCGKKFKHSSHWSCHMKLHTGEKPYVCTMCGKGFVSKHKLSFHMRRCKDECKQVQPHETPQR